MKKIHIGSKINLVEVPDELYGERNFQAIVQHAIDNPIAEFDERDHNVLRHDLGDGLHDIPEGYRVEVKENNIDYFPTLPRAIASLVPIKEESVITTQSKIICNGKINQHGICDKCYQPLQSSSAYCCHLIVHQPDQVSAYKEELINKLESFIDLNTPSNTITDTWNNALNHVINLIKQP